MHPEEIAERKRAWQAIWRNRFADEVAQMAPNRQGRVHDMLKSAFFAGTNHERRKHEPVQVGGVD